MSVIQVDVPRKLPELQSSNSILKLELNGGAASHKVGIMKRKRKNFNKNNTRKYKKKKPTNLPPNFEDISEDIQPANNIFNVNDFAKIISQQANPLPSQADDKIYIEGSGKFKAKNRFKVDQRREKELERSQNENLAIYPTIFTSEAIQIHKIFKAFSLYVCGLFAGVALWQIITSYMAYSKGIKNFLDNYCSLSSPVQCFYYLLFAICIVYTLDRYDISNPPTDFCNKIATFQSGAFCIIIYIIGLIFSLAISNIEYRISFHYPNSSLISVDDPSTANMLYIWQILNLIRGLMAIIGWMVIAVKPLTDRLLKTLSNYQNKTISDPGVFAAKFS